jgi:SAM-dependent methyltransferase
LNWTVLKKTTRHTLQSQDRVLVLGAGDSGLPEEIFDAGCRNVTAIDFSPLLVAAMAEQSHGVLWRVEEVVVYTSCKRQDASQLSFQESSFDAVLDVGLLDSVGAGGEEKMSTVISEALRVLSPGGVYISTSTEPPLYRLPLFARHLDANATQVLFIPRHRDIDPRVRRIDPALDMGKLSIYVSSKREALTIERTASASPETADAVAASAEADASFGAKIQASHEDSPAEQNVAAEAAGVKGSPAEMPDAQGTHANALQGALSELSEVTDTHVDVAPPEVPEESAPAPEALDTNAEVVHEAISESIEVQVTHDEVLHEAPAQVAEVQDTESEILS